MEYVYVNGKTVPAAKAVISVFDRGFMLGDGIFETLRATDYYPQFYEAHFERMKISAKKMGIPLPLKKWQLAKIIFELCKKCHLKDAVIRIILTRGIYDGTLTIGKKNPPTVVITCRPVKGLTEHLYYNGVSVSISSIKSDAAGGMDASIKSINYLANIFAKAEADKSRHYEALFTNQKNEITELSTANFFGVIHDKVVTPPLNAGILPGVTRGKVIEIVEKTNIPFEEKPLSIRQIPKLSEAFLTSSVRGILPIIKIDSQKIGDGKVGNLGFKLMGLYQEALKIDQISLKTKGKKAKIFY